MADGLHISGEHNVWLQFGKSCMGLDVCWCVRGRDSDKITLSPTSTLVARVWYSVEHQQSVWAAKLFDALKQCFANPGKKVSPWICSWSSQELLFLPYLWTAVIFILVYLLSKWKGDLLVDIIQSNFLNVSRQALCLSWYVDILASVLGYKHFSTSLITPVALPYE